MWLCYAALLIGADSDPAEAKAAFDRMEQQVLTCKTLQVQLEVNSGTGKDASLSMKGRLLVAPGDKVRLELDGSMRGRPEKVAMVSNGTKQRMTSTGRPAQDQNTMKQLGEVVLTSLSRGGVFVSLFSLAPADADPKDNFDPAKAFAISDLKLGKKEVISGGEAQAIEYKITPRGAKAAMTVTVWVDVKSNLPVKRIVGLKEGQDTITITETYTKAVVDGKLDEKEFELPK